MRNENQITMIHQLILDKEIEQQKQANEFKECIKETFEKNSPVSVLKKTLKEINSSEEIKLDLLKAGIFLSLKIASKSFKKNHSNSTIELLEPIVLKIIADSNINEDTEEIQFIAKYIAKKMLLKYL